MVEDGRATPPTDGNEQRYRDGTSQADRFLLSPNATEVPIDERTTIDWLKFLKALATSLQFYEGESYGPAGTWANFLNDNDLDALAHYVAQPHMRAFDAETESLLRPHRVLLLAFLKMVERVQGDVNSLTLKHLDYYYRTVLQLETRPPQPDRVNVIIGLAKGIQQYALPPETTFFAGADDHAVDRLYRMTRNQATIINQAVFAEARTVRIDREVTRPGTFFDPENPLADTDVDRILDMTLGPPSLSRQHPVTVRAETLGTLEEVLAYAGDTLEQTFEELDVTVRRIKNAVESEPSTAPHPGITEPVATLEDYLGQVRQIADAFFLSPDETARLLAFLSLSRQQALRSEEWSELEHLLTQSYRGAQRGQRREYLRGLRERRDREQGDGLRAILSEVLSAEDSDRTTSDLASDITTSYLERETDKQQLQSFVEAAASGRVSELPEEDWEALYTILAGVDEIVAGAGVPQQKTWRRLIAMADATAELVQTEATGNELHPRWHTFGRLSSKLPSPSEPTFGWAISSPVLMLSGGERTITLVLVFVVEDRDADNIVNKLTSAFLRGASFRADVTTTDGWHPLPQPPNADGEPNGQNEITRAPGKSGQTNIEVSLRGRLASTAPAITPFEGDAYATEWPALRLMLTDERDYDTLRELSLHSVTIEVSVRGLVPQKLENDHAVLDPAKPFDPFGSAPTVGSRLRIGHADLIPKQLIDVDFNLVWLGRPDDLNEHYAAYETLLLRNDTHRKPLQFSATVGMIADGRFLTLDTSDGDSTFLLFEDDQTPVERRGFPTPPRVTETPRDLASWNRYLVLELNAPDFGHSVYTRVVEERALQLVIDIATKDSPDDSSKYQVPPPYTPKLKSLTLDYTAETNIDLNEWAVSSDRIFHVHPFGFREVTEDTPHLLPQFEDEGELYIGFDNLQPPTDLSVLFQLAEGSADPDLPRQEIRWAVLDGNTWRPFDRGGVRADGTNGLVNSGIIVFALPEVAPSTLLPPGRYWIRASITAYPESVCDVIAIHTQAVSAELVTGRGNAPSHYRAPLPAGSVKRLVKPVPAVKTVEQPYTSVGGRPAEGAGHFNTRVSERLRHKNRAVTPWDIDRLVLEAFPEVYKVQCLRAAPSTPGELRVVVIPNIEGKLPSDPFAPKAPADLLLRIQRFLDARAPLGATVRVQNARYVPVRARVFVRFREGYNPGVYIETLNEAINRFLSPWAYGEVGEIVIGGQLHANVLVNFIETQPYVDYVARPQLFRFREDGSLNFDMATKTGGEWVETILSDEVLVAAREHEINLLSDDKFGSRINEGISVWVIGVDFEVQPG